MSREILFRGKRIDNGEWVEGDLLHRTWSDGETCSYIFSGNYNQGGVGDVKVDPSTVCQYTGLEDENGKKIFEGDIIQGSGRRYIVMYHNDKASFMIMEIETKVCVYLSRYAMRNEFEVIGDRWDTPELLEEGNKE